jgi:hypothetical protein
MTTVAFDRAKFDKALEAAESDSAQRAFKALSSPQLNDATLFALLKHRNEIRSDRMDAYPGLGHVEMGLSEIGHGIFVSIERQLFDFVCGGSDNEDLRKRVINAISGVDGGGLGVVVAGLVALGVPMGVASVAGALIIKLLAKPAIGEVCKIWTSRLEAQVTRQ